MGSDVGKHRPQLKPNASNTATTRGSIAPIAPDPRAFSKTFTSIAVPKPCSDRHLRLDVLPRKRARPCVSNNRSVQPSSAIVVNIWLNVGCRPRRHFSDAASSLVSLSASGNAVASGYASVNGEIGLLDRAGVVPFARAAADAG